MNVEENINLPNAEPENPQQTNEALHQAELGETSVEESDPLTIHNSPLTISPMEVHHHPHVAKKNFKEYFLEFVMIFLAVTMGFFAESYREHLTEKNRIHDYMEEIVHNLQYDTIRCNTNYLANVRVIKGIDSLRTEIKNAINGKINGNALYYYALQYAGNASQAVFNTTAITELKNSGDVRLINNKIILNGIYDYYQRKIYATQMYEFTPSQGDAVSNLLTQFFSLTAFDSLVGNYDITDKAYESEYYFPEILQRNPPLKLLDTNPADLEHLYTEMAKFEMGLKNYNFWLLYTKKGAMQLMVDIQHEYNLKNE
ncbi:MAG: hypothetical protein WAU24_04895 [Chitinophagaceae bacterium]